MCDPRWRPPHPRPALPKRGGWGRSRGCPACAPRLAWGSFPSSCPPRPGMRVKRGCSCGPRPLPQGGGGGGGEEGADGSNYSSDPPPPVAGGRKIGSLRSPGREGRRPPQRAVRSRGELRPGREFPSRGDIAGRSLEGKPSPLPAPTPGLFQSRSQ